MSIHAKMLEFHKRFRGAQKTGYNTHFKQAYFKLEDVHRAVTPLLNELGLYLHHYVTDATCFENKSVVCTVLTDVESGETLQSSFPLPDSANPQVIGSSLTYGQRYNVAGLLCIAEEDDDGEAAAINQPKPLDDKTVIVLRDLADGNEERTAFLDKHLATMAESMATSVIHRWTVAAEKEKAA